MQRRGCIAEKSWVETWALNEGSSFSIENFMQEDDFSQ